MIGLLVRETVLMRRAYDCAHIWAPYNAREEQCSLCSVIVTPAGKIALLRAANRFHGRHPDSGLPK